MTCEDNETLSPNFRAAFQPLAEIDFLGNEKLGAEPPYLTKR